jgi:hypothetical protein
MISAKIIEAMDEVIASLEGLKEVLEFEANKSGNKSDDAGAGKVSGRGAKTATAAVPAKGKGSAGAKARASDDDGDDGTPPVTDDDDDEDLPPPSALKEKGKPAKVNAAKPAAKKAAPPPDDDDEDDGDEMPYKTLHAKVKAMTEANPEGLALLRKLLAKQYKVSALKDLDPKNYAAVFAWAEKLLAEAGDSDDGDDDDDL